MTTRSGCTYKSFQPNFALTIRAANQRDPMHQVLEAVQQQTRYEDGVELILANLNTILNYAITQSSLLRWRAFTASLHLNPDEKYAVYVRGWKRNLFKKYTRRQHVIRRRLNELEHEYAMELNEEANALHNAEETGRISSIDATNTFIRTRARLSDDLCYARQHGEDELEYIRSVFTYLTYFDV